jgi:hypothetical protein
LNESAKSGVQLRDELDRHWLRLTLIAWALLVAWYLFDRWNAIQWLSLGRVGTICANIA